MNRIHRASVYLDLGSYGAGVQEDFLVINTPDKMAAKLWAFEAYPIEEANTAGCVLFIALARGASCRAKRGIQGSRRAQGRYRDGCFYRS